jgi:hypothetical protein
MEPCFHGGAIDYDRWSIGVKRDQERRGWRTKRYVPKGTYGRILERQTISQFGPQNAYMSMWEGE